LSNRAKYTGPGVIMREISTRRVTELVERLAYG
jgi:hypothetical protein